MFKELFVFVHQTAKDYCLSRPVEVSPRNACRVHRNGFISNALFFIAIFTPLYVCLLKDVISILRDFNSKMARGKE